MSKILVVPLPEAGHIFPTLRLAKYLRDQGHEVTYLTAPSLRVWMPDSGFQLEPLIAPGEVEENVSGVHIWTLFSGSGEGKLRRMKLEALLRRIQDRKGFDFLLLDRLLAKGYRDDIIDSKRVVLFSTSLPDWNSLDSSSINLPTIIFCPACFEIPKFLHPYPRLHYVEPSLRSMETESFNLPVPNDRPVVLAAFGTQGVKDRRLEIKCKIIAQLAERVPNVEFVLAVPPLLGRELEIPSMPKNLCIMEKVSQRRVLQRTAAFVTHGGLGSIKESIMAAVPLIVLPVLNDQPFNAMRVRYHGIGEALFPEKLTVDALENLLRDALGGKYKDSLRRMQSQFEAMERAAVSHLLIDAHLVNVENAAKPDFAGAQRAAIPQPNE